MAQGTKITFSKAELEAISKPDFFYIKHAALQNVMGLFGETEREIRRIISGDSGLAQHTDIESPKIFRGENYRQLPYMVLDYPRKFNTETVFAFRSMFWWGKEFSFTLHLQGNAWERYKNQISGQIGRLAGNEFYYCVNSSPWQYNFENENYRMLDELLTGDEFLKNFRSHKFMKLSRKIPVVTVERVPQFASETLSLLLNILKD